MRLSLPPLLLLAALAACHAEKPDWAEKGQQGPLPPQVCGEIEKGVAKLAAAGGIEITEKGEATIPAAAWNHMTAAEHDQLLHTMAFHVACKSGAQSDAQPVVVHDDEGNELARRSISTRVDTSGLLRD
ncbi:MAG TPA: hypothetical protein VKI45_08750 [Allosphingosinicella sp.]|nr:hypothetical protein [Allosphingosinicella sp.]